VTNPKQMHPKQTHPKHTLNDVAAQRIRALRRIMGLTQADLGNKLNITYQQVQKYESGKNNISINTLQRIGEVLEYDPLDLLKGANPHRSKTKNDPASQDRNYFLAYDKEYVLLIKKLQAIENATIRKKLIRLLNDILDSYHDRSPKSK
jgi:transcriptional regulator with XRE-family HTH domain